MESTQLKSNKIWNGELLSKYSMSSKPVYGGRSQLDVLGSRWPGSCDVTEDTRSLGWVGNTVGNDSMFFDESWNPL